ncbi:MAG: SDR family NAD(P)-dependent oxidoreductase [Verrucomicrobiae bacterium]|nr:SDR family NAD(P)-dependent oxidoreductase [Verrucomicrobiae bacterium]
MPDASTLPASSSPAPRIAVVTGAKGGLGSAIVRELESTGRFAKVFAPGRSDLDVTAADSVARFFGELDRIDLLVNNAGLTRDVPIARMAEDQWDKVIDGNLRGAFLCSRAALKLMIRQRSGLIVNIGSFSALRPPPGQAAYAAAKAGLIGLTQSLAEEAGKRNVRVNCVLPGFLEGTGMTRDLPADVIELARQSHVLGRFNTPVEAARFVAFLDTLEAVSGQVFQLDSRLRRW